MARRGVLSNSYVPQLTAQTTVKVLSKLSTNSLYDLCLFWCKWSPLTKPSRAEKAYQEILEMKKRKWTKRKLIDRILSIYWPKGLNLLQTAQIDVQNIIDKPTGFNWVSSTAKTSDDKQFVINLDSKVFLKTLIDNLSNLYLCHMYISKHPHYPLILIRIQVFHYTVVPLVSNAGKQKFILSRKPFFLAIPINSPHIIHSEMEEKDLVTQIVLQTIESSLSTSLRQVRLFRDEGESSVRTLETMHIFKGISRFGCSLGSWAPYADGSVDISPFGDPNEHLEANPDKLYDNTEISAQADEATRQREIRKRIANLRFKGSELPLKSERLYEDNRPIKKRKRNFDEDQEKDADNEQSQNDSIENPYKSIAPVQSLQSEVITSRRGGKETTIKATFEGNDVFAGLHELCVEGIIDPSNAPGWLTGEEGNRHIKTKRKNENDLI